MDFSILLLLLLVFLLTVFILLFLQQKKAARKVIPGPLGLPLIGNLHQFDSSAPHEYLWRLSQKYGPLISLKLGSLPVLVVSSARMAEEVMKTHDLEFCSRPPMVGFRKLSYDFSDIVLAPYNEEWREMRKIGVVHLLSNKRVQAFRLIREDEVSRMIGKISGEASELKVTNLSETVMTFASTLICRIAFGKRYDEQDHQRRRFNSILREMQEMFTLFYFSDYFPKIGWLDRYTGTLSQLEKVFKELDAFYEELIHEHMDHSSRPKSMEGDLIDIMLQLRQENSSSTSLFHLSMNKIKAMLMNVFAAGTDTSAGTIIWAMTALMKNPTIMKKAQAEIREVISKHEKKKTTINEDDLEKFPYLKAIVKETLRLYSPVPLLVPRYTMKNCTIDGYEISRNTVVYVNAWAISRDPEYWEEPYEFLPERFLDGRTSDIDMMGQQFQLIPFGAGRRICPGYSMGLTTVELALANLLHSFDWELPPGMREEDVDITGSAGVSMLKKIDLQIVAKQVTTNSS